MQSSIMFCGGAGEVTGSNFLLDTGAGKILIDCGSREGIDATGHRAQDPFSYNPADITALLVTHAHQDHIGRIPELVRHGFRGPIHSTAPTKDLSALMLIDALGILEREALERGDVAPYERTDIDRALSNWHTHAYHAPFALGELTVELFDSGHILGASLIKCSRGGRSVLFTGDIGNSPEPLLPNPEQPTGIDYLVMESVYGDRAHDDQAIRKTRLREIIEDTRARNGTLLIPSFSIERTQVLLSEINDMVEREHMLPIPVYLDAPLALQVTEVFARYPEFLNQSSRDKLAAGDDIYTFKGLQVTRTVRESTEANNAPTPKVIIAGAGMSVGGRIRSHERALLSDKNTTVLFVGYQAPGTVGRRLQDGATKLEIDGEWVRVHAAVASIGGYSGHADRDQLLGFLAAVGAHLERAFIVMGEPQSEFFFAQRAKDFLGIDAYVPHRGEHVEINL